MKRKLNKNIILIWALFINKKIEVKTKSQKKPINIRFTYKKSRKFVD